MPHNSTINRRTRTKITCTLGPASDSPETIERLIKAGMNIARLNLSHGSYASHTRTVKTIRRISRQVHIPVAILIDLPGPKYRTGRMVSDSVVLEQGAELVLTERDINSDADTISLNFPGLRNIVKNGSRILVDDGAMQLRVIGTEGQDIRCRVVVGGVLTPGRGVVVPGMQSCNPFVSDSLREHIAFAVKQQPDFIAISFVCDSDNVTAVKELIALSGKRIPVISKIERGQAVKNFTSILEVSDGIMVARGDLGVDIPIRKIPLVQKDIIRRCNRAGKTVITATQMLESMVNSARPTRAEVTDVSNAIFDGTDAIMLSAETSVGKYPVATVEMMAQIAHETESQLPYERWIEERDKWVAPQTDELISYDACYTAHRLKAALIIAFTESGSTARRVSKYRPRVPILAITSDNRIAHQLQMYWGVHAVKQSRSQSISQLFSRGTKLAMELGMVKSGDLVVITSGVPLGVTGTTNLLKVERVP